MIDSPQTTIGELRKWLADFKDEELIDIAGSLLHPAIAVHRPSVRYVFEFSDPEREKVLADVSSHGYDMRDREAQAARTYIHETCEKHTRIHHTVISAALRDT